jgi:hypothetical protein
VRRLVQAVLDLALAVLVFVVVAIAGGIVLKVTGAGTP